jgi:hypothetical protein
MISDHPFADSLRQGSFHFHCNGHEKKVGQFWPMSTPDR